MDKESIPSDAVGRLLSDPEALRKALALAAELKNSGALDGILPKAGKNEGTASAEYGSGEDAYILEEKTDGERSGSGQRDGRSAGRNDGAERTNAAKRSEAPDADEGAGGNRRAQRAELLLAMKPYLSKERQEKVDLILRVLKLLETAEQLGAIGAGLGQ